MTTRLSTATALVLTLSLSPALAQQTSGPSSGQAGQINVLTQQQPDHRLARDVLGLSVYNAQDQNIGKVDDLVLDKDNKVIAAVIGVGGFLGIGKHDVAIPIDQIQIREEERPRMVAAPPADSAPAPRPGAAPPAGTPAARPAPGPAVPAVKTMVVRLDATRDQLKSMPSFATLRDQERRRAPDRPATAPAPSQVRPQRTQ